MINLNLLASGYTQEFCSVLLCVHAFTKCDSVSAFKCIGKVKSIKWMRKSPKYLKVLASVDESWHVAVELIADLEVFTYAMYGI